MANSISVAVGEIETIFVGFSAMVTAPSGVLTVTGDVAAAAVVVAAATVVVGAAVVVAVLVAAAVVADPVPLLSEPHAASRATAPSPRAARRLRDMVILLSFEVGNSRTTVACRPNHSSS